MIKKLISAMTAMAMSASVLVAAAAYEDEPLLGLTRVQRVTTALSGAVQTTPAAYHFEYGQQDFIFLDSKEIGGKEYYLIFTDELYGQRAFHNVTENNDNVWSVTDPDKIGYWLNNEFISSSYTGKKLPQDIIDHIYYQNIWHTEPTRVEGYTTELSMLTTSGVALMSVYEFKQYNGKYGAYVDGVGNTWAWMRTARGTDGTTAANLIASLGITQATGTKSANYYVRPIFWVNEDFFKEHKVTNPGSFIAQNIIDTVTVEELDAAGYSTTEIDNWFKKPVAEITEFTGSGVSGKTLSMDYSYSSDIGAVESGSVIQWYSSDSENGIYQPIDGANEKNYTLTENEAGLYIKASVTPKSTGNVNSVGAEVWTDSCIGPVYGEDQIEKAIEDIDGASADTVLDRLEFYNDVFNLDLSFDGYSEEEKTNALEIFAGTTLSDTPESVAVTFSRSQALAKLNHADEADIPALLEDEALSLDMTIYSGLADKTAVAAAVYNKNLASTTQLEELFYPAVALAAVNEADSSDIKDVLLACDEYLSEDISGLDTATLRAVGTKVLGTYESLDELDAAVSAAITAINKALGNEVMLGLTAGGRISTALEGAVADTPAAYHFKYDGKNFVLLDSKEKDGKKYYLIFADDVYGATRPFHSAASDYNHVWSVSDPDKIGYWLNNEFISEDYEGDKLTQEIIDNLDYSNIWHTEPVKNVDGYNTEESMLTMSGVSLMSLYEFRKYNGMFGTNVGGEVKRAWLRTARSNDVATTTTVQFIDTTPGTTNAQAANIGVSSANANYCFVRPIFWLCEDFFRNYKIEETGGFVAYTFDSVFTREELTEIGYTDEEINAWFKAPEAEITSLSGNAVEGDTLTAAYTYSSDGGFEENGSIIQWYSAESSDGTYQPIAGATGSSYIVKTADAGKYIKAAVTPVCNANINPRGSEVFSTESIGPIYGKTQLQAVIDEIDDADKTTVLSKIEPHNGVLRLDISFEGFSDEEKADALEILANADITTLNVLRSEFAQSKALAKLNAEADSANVITHLQGADMGLTLTQFNELKNNSAVISAVYNKDFTSTAAFEDAFYKMTAVRIISEADRTNIKERLLANDNLLDANLSSLDDYKLGLVGTEIIGIYGDFTALDSAVTTAFGKVTTTVQIPQTPSDGSDASSSGGGGGGGGGLGGGSVSLPAESTQTSLNQPVKQYYTDMTQAAWAGEAVTALTERGIVSGDGNGKFRPNDSLKREEFVKMAVLAFASLDFQSETAFTDVAEDAWYAPFIKAAVANGIINGISESVFGINNEITRQDMAVVIYRAIGTLNSGNGIAFADMDKVAPYAANAVNALSGAGLLNGDGTNVNPTQNATRAMAAQMIYSAIMYMEGSTK